MAPDTAARPSLEPGDRIPFAYGMDEAQRYWSFEDQAGAPCVLVLAGEAAPATVMPAVNALVGRAAVRVLAAAGAPGWATAVMPPGVGLVHVMTPDIFAAGAPRLLVVDRAMRLVASFELSETQAALAALDALSSEPARLVDQPAPVLATPRVFPPDLCGRLIAAFEAGAHAEGAMASVDGEGRAINRVDEAKKRRRDLELAPGSDLHAEAVAALSGRLVPEIAKAFQVRVAHLDRVLVARYDDTGGYFRRHRDNASAHLAYREFAVSVNLNTGEYAGGELTFPEFNDHRHSPPTGGALVFSASLLHEALPVTKGRRYVLLSFLHSDAAEARRRATLDVGVTEPA